MNRWHISLLFLLLLLLPMCALAEEDLSNQNLTSGFKGGTLKSGHYTMVEDVTLTETWEINAESDLNGKFTVINTIELDLNGYQLMVTGKARILIDGGAMTITDSTGGGRIIGEMQPDDSVGDHLFVISNALDNSGKLLNAGVLNTQLVSTNLVQSNLGLLYIDGDSEKYPGASLSGGRYVADLS